MTDSGFRGGPNRFQVLRVSVTGYQTLLELRSLSTEPLRRDMTSEQEVA
jgi:hypothetical protein